MCLSGAEVCVDFQCTGLTNSLRSPGPVIRGGWYADGTGAGVLNVKAISTLTFATTGIGFRCAR